MTKAEQRKVITVRAASRLTPAQIGTLRELVSMNRIGKDRDADAEAKAFNVSIPRLSARTGHMDVTLYNHIATFESLGLISVTRREGRRNLYLLHLSPMLEWETATEALKRKAEQRTADKAAYARQCMAAKRAAMRNQNAVQNARTTLLSLAPRFIDHALNGFNAAQVTA